MAGGHAWQGACMTGGMCDRGTCVAGGVHGGGCVQVEGMHGREGRAWQGCAWQGAWGVCSGGHAWWGGACVPWQIPWDTVNERAVRILLECILV